MGDFLPDWAEQAIGAVVLLIVLLDVFLTVLYARAGSGIISHVIARATWLFFKGLSKLSHRYRGSILSFCGPAVLVFLFLGWGFILAFGAGLMIHPVLGTSIAASYGNTPTDFVTAVFAGGSSLSVVGTSEYEPTTPGFRLLYLFNSLVGMSVVTLTLTYLLQVYNALQNRNSFALKIHLASGETGDAAELLAGLGPEDQFSAGYTNLADMAAELTHIKESHHFYPVLFFFRFTKPYYSTSRSTLIALDTISLMKSGLSDEKHAWLKESLSTAQLWRGSILLLETMADFFSTDAEAEENKKPDADRIKRWRLRYDAALRRLRDAHIETIADEEAGFANYVQLRSEWDSLINSLAPKMAYELEDIDTALTHPEEADRRKDFQGRWRSAG